ncbi:MAG: hypothetical protein ACFFCO_11965 [Promethearchaeota archaeon]
MFFLVVTLSASYAYIGAAIKFLDDVHDHNWFFRGRTPICWSLALSTAILSGIWMAIDTYSAALALALIISLSLTWKVDNRYFVTISILALLVAFLLGFHLIFLLPALITLVVLIPTFALDEILHALPNPTHHGFTRWLLHRRPLAKIMVVVLSCYFLFTFHHTLAFWSFDIAYDLVGFLGTRRCFGTTS